MAFEVGLSSAVAGALRSSQNIAALQARTQLRLATGRRFNSLLENPQAVSVSRSLSNRASDFLSVKNNIGQGISKASTAIKGLDSIAQTLQQLKAIAVQHAGSNSPTEQAALGDQFNVLSQQLDGLARDSSYGGTNLISASPDTLSVPVNEDGSSAVTITGSASDSASLGVTLDVATIDAAISSVRSTAQSIGVSAAALEIRAEFTDNLVNTLEAGSAKLTNADLNEEAANAISLQTRRLLATAATKIAVQSERAILQLF